MCRYHLRCKMACPRKEIRIPDALTFTLKVENITTKADLELWCGDRGREKLHGYIKRMASEHWNRIGNPESYLRYYYQTMLSGYKIYGGQRTSCVPFSEYTLPVEDTVQNGLCIKDAVTHILRAEGISTKAEFELWCGDRGREKLYGYVKRMSRAHWHRLNKPENSVRYQYQSQLQGYKHHR